MANLLSLIVSLAEDRDLRASFRADPDAALIGLDDLTGEDVAAATDLARVKVDPARASVLAITFDLRAGDDESERNVAIRALAQLCDAFDTFEAPDATTGA
ncbi:MAG: hypothetical protein U5K30_16025 [Acidimicrobiales bacterium]|nr:hypothetical protein [Acidimicrobiales bacterium]